MTSNPVLLDIGSNAYAHQSEVDIVKSRIGIEHNYFDCWLFGFLENKNFNIEETVAKLHRREEFEKNELATYEFTDWMRENMHKGIIQVIGNDKAGRVTFDVCTARDKPESKHRAESRRTFDMFVSYGTRLRPESKRCQMTLLVNQSKASMWSNTDMTLQAEIALRIAKYYPGMVDKVYVCNMGRILSAAAKPLFQRLPSIVSDRIQIVTESEVKHGKLLEYFDAEVLPVDLGGKNACDTQEHYSRFANIVQEYFLQLRQAVRNGMTIKEWELQNLRQAGYLQDSSEMDLLKSSILQPSGKQHAALVSSALGCSVNRLNSLPNASSASMRDGAHAHTLGTPHPSFRRGSELSAGAAVAGAVCDDVCPVWIGNSMHLGSDYRMMAESGSDLFTCDSVHGREVGYVVDVAGAHRASTTHCVDPSCVAQPAARKFFFDEFLEQFATIESFFRLSLEEMHRREWLRFLRQEVDERTKLVRTIENLNSEIFLRSLPPILRIVAKGFVWMCLMVMSGYFFLSTIFLALVGATTMTFFFFAMFSYQYNMLTYGLALFVVSAEFMLCCSRGFDMLRNTYSCRLLQALRPFGSKAFIFQLAVCGLAVVGYFIFFCVMSTRMGVMLAMLYSIGVGWLFTALLILIYHVIFAFGIRSMTKTSYAHGSRVNHAEATLYLFLNVELDEEVLMSQSSMECIVPVMVALLAVASGVFYIINENVFFLCSSFLLTTGLLLLCTLLISVNNASSSANIIVIGLFYSGAFWMTTVFTMTRFGGNAVWVRALMVVMCVMLFFLTVGFVGIYGPLRPSTRTWFFRVIWLFIVLYFIGCDIALFVLEPSLGGVVLVLGSHLILTNFRTNEATNTYGVCAVTLGFIATVLVCCIVGDFSYRQLYNVSVLANPAARTSAGDTLHDAYSLSDRNMFSPICTQRFGSEYNLTTRDLARFVKLGYNLDPDAQQRDLQVWFPLFKIVDQSEGDTWNLFSFTVFHHNTSNSLPAGGASYAATGSERSNRSTSSTTIIAVRPGANAQAVMESMTLGIFFYTMSILLSCMPTRLALWLDRMVAYPQSVSPLLWRSTIPHVEDMLRRVLNTYARNSSVDQMNHSVYIVGNGLTGTQAALMGIHINSAVQSVVFSPMHLMIRPSSYVNQQELWGRMIFLQPYNSVFNPWFTTYTFTEFIPCLTSLALCDEIDSILMSLSHFCYDDVV